MCVCVCVLCSMQEGGDRLQLEVYNLVRTNRAYKSSFHLRSSCTNQSHFQQQQPVVMMCYHLLSWAFLLVASGPLLAHPITESAEMPYPGPGEWKVISSLSLLFTAIH